MVHGWIYVKDFDKKQWDKKYIRMVDSAVYLCQNEDEMVCSVDIVLFDHSFVWLR